MIYGTVLCLGDSLTYGARAPRGYPEILPELLREGGTTWSTLNAGVSKETTRDILLRTPAALGHVARMPGAKWCSILAGTNDAKGSGLDKQVWVSLYGEIVNWPRRYGIPTILCTLPPVVAPLMPCFTGASQAWIDHANEAIRNTAAHLNGNPSPVVLCELAAMPRDLLVDGVHCKPEGYQYIAERVAEVIRKGP